MSPRHFSLMIKGHSDNKIDNYKLVRLLMFTMVKLLGDPKGTPKTPESLWSLPGDENNLPTDDEYREIFKRLTK